jgi:hypothetical protein
MYISEKITLRDDPSNRFIEARIYFDDARLKSKRTFCCC